MAKFGLFEVGSPMNPREEYEGEYLLISGECVSIMATTGKGGDDHAFAVIRLAPGQSVRKLKDGEAKQHG